MNVRHSLWTDNFDLLARQTGACAWGICNASPLPPDVVNDMSHWIKEGKNAGMDYLERHVAMKENIDSVLPGCKSVVSLAFPYYTELKRKNDAAVISRHALGEDYHRLLKDRLKPLAAFIKDEFGGRTRTCVDSAPVAERYWAMKCGIGAVGRNGLLYVPGYGSWIFLAEILTTESLPEKKGDIKEWRMQECIDCRKCIDACPGNAIGTNGKLDCRKCRAYLTIEDKSENLPTGVSLHNRVYGCDICQEACPVNQRSIPDSDIFIPHSHLLDITREEILHLTEEQFRKLTHGTSMERVTLRQLKRNAGGGQSTGAQNLF